MKNDSLASDLFLEIGDDYIASCAVAEENSIPAFQLYNYESDENFYDVLINLKENLPQENVGVSVNVVWQNAYATCVPKKFSAECNASVLLKKILNAPSASGLFTATVNDMDLLYFVEENKLRSFKKIFPQINITHKYATIIHRVESLSFKKEIIVYVVFYNKKIMLSVFVRNSLQMINMYPLAVEADVIYHLLNVAKQLRFDWEDAQLIVSGGIDGDSALYKQIYNFIPHIEADVLEEYSLNTEQLKEYPSHYFSHYFSNIAYFKK